MPVYVDQPDKRYGRMLMCHMVATTEDELHAMADRIGVARRWFQSDASWPHYDICKAMRAKAVRAGAIEKTNRELATVVLSMRRIGGIR